MVDKEGATRACKDTNPIIDGRKANVNLAYLGAKQRPNGNGYYQNGTVPNHVNMNNNYNQATTRIVQSSNKSGVITTTSGSNYQSTSQNQHFGRIQQQYATVYQQQYYIQPVPHAHQAMVTYATTPLAPIQQQQQQSVSPTYYDYIPYSPTTQQVSSPPFINSNGNRIFFDQLPYYNQQSPIMGQQVFQQPTFLPQQQMLVASATTPTQFQPQPVDRIM
ncbi:uncharacterized protein TRIADDRAFT_58176 [Trichoplax adhaerens]|uniref:RRM domain-containing protein n=1 Tax=Trichoplax adhaerens TaxID=10228 RepID=B3S130_TRIAD|nr:hypothetical protein TRIADDRAFT_58176 [Trichoplax adhaerens]EDV23166.1 hypothetical protein TRIADDRAFT_58176 [Trichoplax adhaerens]|eukprot:XP_002114076.1 hypothetical protein TRIADDRAFT_58176 [Trichoplax adhaerens]